MKSVTGKGIFFILVWVFVAFFTLADAHAAPAKKPVLLPGKTFLPLRVLARPFSNIYAEAKSGAAIVQENVPVFQNYYVYTQPAGAPGSGDGWYEIGSDTRGTVLGWMKSEDVMEWKQSLCLAYQHPSGRQPVLMFEDRQPLNQLILASATERVQKSRQFYDSINNHTIPDDFPVISAEPKDAIDINRNFYLLPILEHSAIMLDGREARLLKIASAPKSGRGDQDKLKKEADTGKTVASPVSAANPAAGIPKNIQSPASANPEAASNPSDPEAGLSKIKQTAQKVFSDENRELLKNLKMDLVYVVDMTASMQPYIDATLETIRNITTQISNNPELNQNVRFGLWGYRDSLEIPGLEFTTQNFTPELQQVARFQNILATAKAAQSGSQDYPEDVFTGMADALQKTRWDNDALKIIILLGDAPAHDPGHKWNQSGQSAETIRSYADDNRIYIMAVHIRDDRAQQFWDQTEQHFTKLAENRGLAGESSYWSVNAMDMNSFKTASGTIADGLISLVNSARKGQPVAPETPTTIVAGTGSGATGQNTGGNQSKMAGSETEVSKTVSSRVMNLGYAALVDWIGKAKNTEAPRDITAWVIDKDLLDPSIQSLDVRVLVSKNQLDSMRTVLQEIMTAGRRGAISGEKFFDALQAIPAVVARSGEQIKNARSLAESGLIPEFLVGLPYESQIMTISNDLWASWSQDQQDQFLNNIQSKINLYAGIHDNIQGWVALNPGDDPDQHVYALSRDDLP